MTDALCFYTTSPEETSTFGERLAEYLEAGDIVAFEGELGAGKTCMIRGIAKALGVKSNITSSSFIVMRSLEGRIPVRHFDLYRLSSEEELFDIGYDEFMFSDGISLVEWAEKLGDLIGDRYLLIKMEYDGNDYLRRKITIVPFGKRFQEITKSLAQ